MAGKWKDAITRPHWSDQSGNISQPREDFDNFRNGWHWEGNWEKRTEHSIALVLDEGVNVWTEEIFEYQDRIFLEQWPDESKSKWEDLVSEC